MRASCPDLIVPGVPRIASTRSAFTVAAPTHVRLASTHTDLPDEV
jgi:hypothetical protein